VELTHCRTQMKQEVSVELYDSLQNTKETVSVCGTDSLQNTNETTRCVCGTIWLTAEHKRNKKSLWNYLTHCRTQTRQDVSMELYDSLQNTNETTRSVCETIWLTAEHKRNNKLSVELYDSLHNTNQQTISVCRTGCNLYTSRRHVRMLQWAELVAGAEQENAYRSSVRKSIYHFRRQRRWKEDIELPLRVTSCEIVASCFPKHLSPKMHHDSLSQNRSSAQCTTVRPCALCSDREREIVAGGSAQGEQVVPEIRRVNGIVTDSWCGSQCRQNRAYVTSNISQKWSGHEVWDMAWRPAVLPNGTHSFCSLPHDRTKASSKASSTRTEI